MCLTEPYSKTKIGEQSLCLLHFLHGIVWKEDILYWQSALKYAIMKAQVNRKELKLKKKHQLLVYANYVNLLRKRKMDTIKKNTQE